VATPFLVGFFRRVGKRLHRVRFGQIAAYMRTQ